MAIQSRFNLASAGRHYRNLELASRVGEANPHALVALLYEELLRSLDVIIKMAGDGAALTGNAHFTKVQSILIALEASLDFEHGGELAPILARIYGASRRDLAGAVACGDAGKLAELRAAISNIAYAWAALSAV